MKRVLLAAVTLILIAIGAFWYHERAEAPTVETPAAPTATAATSTPDFVSADLGIAFDYKPDPKYPNIKTHALEKGDTVYVYDATIADRPEDGQWVRVFDKSPSESFVDAIRRVALKNFPSPDCKITSYPTDPGETLEKAVIEYPESDTPGAPFWEHADLCNTDYDVANGIRYFAYDPAHSDRFFFFSIGQYAIVTTGDRMWQSTFKVLAR